MTEFDVQAMSCGHCEKAVKQAIAQVDPQARVEVDLTTKKVRVESAQSREQLARALADAGYAPA